MHTVTQSDAQCIGNNLFVEMWTLWRERHVNMQIYMMTIVNNNNKEYNIGPTVV